MHLPIGQLCAFLIVSLAGAAPPSEGGLSSSAAFPTGDIPRLSLQLDVAALAALQSHPRYYARAKVVELKFPESTPHPVPLLGRRAEGVVYRNVAVHLKGNYGTFQAYEKKPSLTLNFDKFVQGQKFHGVDKVHLNNSLQDDSFLSEVLCRELFQAVGVPVARAAHASLEMNGRDAGLYVLVEGYNKTFLKRHFADAGGHLYDSEFMHDITEPLKCSAGGGPPDRGDLQELVAACGEGSGGSVEQDRLLSERTGTLLTQ